MHRITEAIRLFLAVALTFLVIELLNELSSYLSLGSVKTIGRYIFVPSSHIAILIACVLGTLVAKRFFLIAILLTMIPAWGFAIHILQRVGENIPDNPTYIDILINNIPGLIIDVLLVMLAVFIGNYLKSLLLSSGAV